MSASLGVDEYDAIAHDPTQLTLGSFERGSRGPYPGHPFGDRV